MAASERVSAPRRSRAANEGVVAIKSKFGAQVTAEWRTRCGYDESGFLPDPVLPVDELQLPARM